MNKKQSNLTSLYFLLSLIILVSGYVFYLLVRAYDPLFGIELFSFSWTGSLSLYFKNSYATFAHVLSLSFLCYALVGARRQYKVAIVVFWSIVNIAFELLQLPIFSESILVVGISGTFDYGDIIAVLSAGVIFYVATGLIESQYKITNTTNFNVRSTYSLLGLPIAAVFGVVSILASSTGDDSYFMRDKPVYMSYAELRADPKIETNRQLLKSGKIYIYQDLLIVSEPNKGIHIYDNTDTTAPIHKVFINLPGNLDIAVRNGYLYADSFIDLVTININDLNSMALVNSIKVNRIKDVFPYDPYQAIAKSDRSFYIWDKSKGVIVGVKPYESTRPK